MKKAVKMNDVIFTASVFVPRFGQAQRATASLQRFRFR